ncbi:MAG: sulfite exporter TauE/SafE family protein [Clostridia bacterium]|nr:sulfite exporter TauE/SafE family protein [Clostridia bacterium]
MLIFLIGFLMGILSGLAIGGGTLLVPALIYLVGTEQHVAQGVSLAAFIPTALVAVVTHYRQGNVKIKLALYLIVGSVGGAVIGSLLAHNLNARILKKIFGVFLIAMGIYEYMGKSKLARIKEMENNKGNTDLE